MTEPEPTNESLDALFDDYLNGQLDMTRTRELEARLLSEIEVRRAFVRYTRMHTDLLLELRARKASDRALELIGQELPDTAATAERSQRDVRAPRRSLPRRLTSLFAASAVLLLVVWGGWQLFGPRPASDEAVAWLVNAQNCTWTDGEPPDELRAGRAVRIDRGLADIRFRCGTRVLIEGPAHLDLVSARSVRLRQGKLTARAPADAIGFEVLSPQGKVIDLGTEFGVSVAANGVTDIYVFEGQVEAHSEGKTGKLNLGERQAARIAAGQITPTDSDPRQFVRAIVPSPVVTPRWTKLTFQHPIDGTLRDRTGAGTGLSHRLPGTGETLAVHDEHLRLDPAGGRLELTATRSDLNTQYRLRRGEYLGVRLSDLGFTGTEDFEITAVFPEIPALEFIGQFGLYAGARSDRAIRGGVLKLRKEGAEVYTQFLVNNPDGRDADLYEVGLLRPGTDLRLTLRREAGKYTLTVENLTAGGASTLAIRHPDYLDPERDLYVGLFAAEPRSDVGRKLIVREFQATVWARTR
jgi:FecR protein